MGRRQHDGDDRIPVNSGGVRVMDSEGGYFTVDGTSLITREPRGITPAREDELSRQAWLKGEFQRLGQDEKWCYKCGHVRKKRYFRSDVTRPDGLYVMCTECENTLRRLHYAQEKAAQGTEVRPYQRRNGDIVPEND